MVKSIKLNELKTVPINKKYIFSFCIIVFVISRVIIFFEYNLITNLTHNTKSLIDNLWLFDSGWFQTVVTRGYDFQSTQDGANWPFFPIWPLLLKLFSFNGLFSIKITGIILNQAILLLSFFMFYLYLLENKFSQNNIKFGIILLALSPANIYFCSGLSEPSFLLLSISSFYFLQKERIYLSILCGALLSATRMVGCFFVISFLYHRYKTNGVKPYRLLFEGLCVCSGLTIYMLYLQIHMGDFLAFFHVQKMVPGWARPGIDWTNDPIGQIQHIIYSATIYDKSAFFISFILITFYIYKNGYIKEAIFNLLCVFPTLISGSLWNSFRFGVALFTFYFGCILMSKKSIIIKILLLSFAIAMSMICWFHRVIGSWYFA